MVKLAFLVSKALYFLMLQPESYSQRYDNDVFDIKNKAKILSAKLDIAI